MVAHKTCFTGTRLGLEVINVRPSACMRRDRIRVTPGIHHPADFTDRMGLGYDDSISHELTTLADWAEACKACSLSNAMGPGTQGAFLFDEDTELDRGDAPYLVLLTSRPLQTAQDWLGFFPDVRGGWDR